jgi:hypothetical protein
VTDVLLIAPRGPRHATFFALDVNAVGGELAVDARVPEGSEASLDVLLSLAPSQ